MRFLVLVKKATRLDLQASSFTAGTHSSCDLVLSDPIAAQKHCEFRLEKGRFVVQDAGTGTGTFVNGFPAEQATPVADGDDIVAGATRLTASIAEEGPTLTLQLESGFHFVRGRAGEFQRDRDMWVRTEVGMGRFRPLRWANITALVSVPILLGIAVADPDPLFDPGPLSPGHAGLFQVDVATAVPLDALHVQVAEQGCRSCHVPLGGSPMERCAQCHSDLMGSQHPFADKHRDAPEDQLVSAAWAPGACSLCHVEHRDGFVPDATVVAQSCPECHGGTDLEREGFRVPVIEPVAFDRSREYSSFEFGHDDHVQVDCTTCHDQGPSDGLGEFRAVPFETCATCHVTGSRDETVATLPGEENTWTVGWHGTEGASETCGQCHADNGLSFDPALNQVTRYPTEVEDYDGSRARYQLARRSHEEFLVDHAGAQDCSECHLNPQTLSARQTVTGVFWHGLHMDREQLPRTADEQRELSATCLQCHAGRRESETLTAAALGVFTWSSTEACSQCHREAPDELQAPSPVPADLQALGATVSQADFPHRFHLGSAPDGPLAQGCFTCHEFRSGPGADPFMSVPITRPEARDCTTCHSGHENIAGNACRQCHPSTDGAYNVFLGPNPPADRPIPTRGWPGGGAFLHSDPPGHLEAVNQDCGICHSVGSAASLREVPIPTEADPACVQCHLEQRQRFHWRRGY